MNATGRARMITIILQITPQNPSCSHKSKMKSNIEVASVSQNKLSNMLKSIIPFLNKFVNVFLMVCKTRTNMDICVKICQHFLNLYLKISKDRVPLVSHVKEIRYGGFFVYFS